MKFRDLCFRYLADFPTTNNWESGNAIMPYEIMLVFTCKICLKILILIFKRNARKILSTPTVNDKLSIGQRISADQCISIQ